DARDRNFGSVHYFVPIPYDGGTALLGNADDVLQDLTDVIIDPDRVRFEGRRQFSILNHERISDHSAGEIAGPQAINRISVPDPANINAVFDLANELVKSFVITSLDAHVWGCD